MQQERWRHRHTDGEGQRTLATGPHLRFHECWLPQAGMGGCTEARWPCRGQQQGAWSDRAATVCLAVKGVLADNEHPLFAIDVDANVDADHLVVQIGGCFVTTRNLGHGQQWVWFRVARDHRKFVLCDGANSLEAWPTRYVPWKEWMVWEPKPASTTKTPATPNAPAKGVPGSHLEEESKSKSKREHEHKKRKKEERAKCTAPAPTLQAKQAVLKAPFGPVHQPHLVGGLGPPPYRWTGPASSASSSLRSGGMSGVRLHAVPLAAAARQRPKHTDGRKCRRCTVAERCRASGTGTIRTACWR